MLALDYVYWTEHMDHVTQRLAALPDVAGAKSRTVYCTGRFSETAQAQIEARGFRVFQNIQSPKDEVR